MATQNLKTLFGHHIYCTAVAHRWIPADCTTSIENYTHLYISYARLVTTTIELEKYL